MIKSAPPSFYGMFKLLSSSSAPLRCQHYYKINGSSSFSSSLSTIYRQMSFLNGCQNQNQKNIIYPHNTLFKSSTPSTLFIKNLFDQSANGVQSFRSSLVSSSKTFCPIFQNHSNSWFFSAKNFMISRFSNSTKSSTRPMSPFHIYQPQLTWVMSIAFRVFGAGLALVVYGFGIAVVLTPLDTGMIIKFLSSVPPILFYFGKLCIAAPFTYHYANGIRHLLWDSGRALTLKGVYNSGYSVLAATALSTVLLVWI